MWPFSSSPKPASSPAPAAASSAADKCPVSEETRVQWLAAAKARNQSAESPHQAAAAAAASSTPVPAAAPAPAPTPLVSAPPAAPEDACPVDENTRLKWLAAQKAGGQATSPHPPSSPFATAAASSSSKAPSTADALSLEREVSSIPRVSTADLPQLSEHADTAAFYTPEQQHWVYPSEQQFYAAMERKQHNPSAVDMKTLVPIHNAVNEEAWRAVRAWEHGLGGDGCGGIKLKTFKGTPGALTPKSFVNRFLFGCVLGRARTQCRPSLSQP